MKPIVLIHGYSAESEKSDKRSIEGIYGDLPKTLRRIYGASQVVEIDLSRYVSLEDGITLDDSAHGLHRVLNDRFDHLLRSGFHCLVHSTGALVIRNWLRRFSPRPSPLQNLVYLAGANFGSGWAHVGKGQLAKWGRMVFQGTERGIGILDALELGSDWTLDLHLYFLDPKNSLPDEYKVYEHVVIGTQADAGWFSAPVRYAKEDGADGVVRVSGSNLNFEYVKFVPNEAARTIGWQAARTQLRRDRRRSGRRESFYEVAESSRPGVDGRPRIPFAIPYACAHSGEDMGIVTGSEPREQVLKLIDLALKTTARNWSSRIEKFDAETAATYQQALTAQAPRGLLRRLLTEPRAQYDRHAQVIIRLRDQDDRPIEHFDIFFDSLQRGPADFVPIDKLIEHNHVNHHSPNIITFYLRTDAIDGSANDWVPRVPKVHGCFLEITATEPETEEILYLPFRRQFSGDELVDFIQPHRTTLIDVRLQRLPSPQVFQMKKL